MKRLPWTGRPAPPPPVGAPALTATRSGVGAAAVEKQSRDEGDGRQEGGKEGEKEGGRSGKGGEGRGHCGRGREERIREATAATEAARPPARLSALRAGSRNPTRR